MDKFWVSKELRDKYGLENREYTRSEYEQARGKHKPTLGLEIKPYHYAISGPSLR